MNLVKTSDLRPGQIFSEPVYSEGEHMLVPARIPVRQKDIDFLVNWNIDSVLTQGELVTISVEPEQERPEEELPEPDNFEMTAPQDDLLQPIHEDFLMDIFSVDSSPSEPEEEPVSEIKGPVNFSISDVQQNTGPYRAYKNLIEKVAAIFTGIKSGVDVEMRVINNIGMQLLQDLRDYPESFVDYILGGEVTGHELAKSSVNTAILSALTAQELKLKNHKINNIVAGALLHDVGMLRLSKGITEKKGQLSEAELEQIKSHPVHTSKIVTKELFGSQEINLIALQHHERWDGKGYPDQIIGPSIDLGARIVSVADAFEAMVSKKSYRKSIVGYQAVKNLLADNGRRFDPAVIMAFTKIMGIYPIGSILKLNDGSIARVDRLNIEAPLRPIIQILINKDGKTLRPGERPTIDLLSDKKLFIKNALDTHEYS